MFCGGAISVLRASNKSVETFFMSDGGVRAMAGNNDGVIGQGIQSFQDRCSQLCAISARQVTAAHRALEQGVAGDQETVLIKMETAAAGCVPGCMNAGAACFKDLTVCQFKLRLGQGRVWQAPHMALPLGAVPEEAVRRMKPDWSAGLLMDVPGCHDMVQVCMCLDDAGNIEAQAGSRRKNTCPVTAGVKYPAGARVAITEDGAIALQWANRNGFSDQAHGSMVPFLACPQKGPGQARNDSIRARMLT